jgi:hypothetical protein
MNTELERIVRAAGAPEQAMAELWFVVFCQQFADLLIQELEADSVDTK